MKSFFNALGNANIDVPDFQPIDPDSFVNEEDDDEDEEEEED